MAAAPCFVIVGASLAGAKAAEALRTEGFDGRIVLVGAEADRPYERPPLSKQYLRGEAGFDAAAVHPETFYAEHDIDLRLSTTVTKVDVDGAQVELASGERVAYDRLLLCTGAEPRRLTVPGAALPGVLYLRTVEDADAIRAAITGGGPLVVIGAGWIGAEVAASARQMGADVTVVETASVPLEHVLGREVGAIYRDLHAAHGVHLHFGVGIESVQGDRAVESVRLTDGSTVPAAAVVVGVGVTPRTELAENAGLKVDNGVLTDEYLASSAPGVYAAGDIARNLYPMYGTQIRLEHWSAALNQGPVAAKNMLGRVTAYDRVPFFYSDQYDFSMEYRGWTPAFDQVVFRGDPTGSEFLVFWLSQAVVVAAMNVNIWDQADAIEAMLRAKRPVKTARLADPNVPLEEVAKG